VTTDLPKPVVKYWTNIHPDLGADVSKGLNGG
jgi:hypothetical protein